MADLRLVENTVAAADLQKALLIWGQAHFRLLPWRLTHDPYRILIAEMLFYTFTPGMTQVYERFIQQYPTIFMIVYITQQKLQNLFHPSVQQGRVEQFYETIERIITDFDLQIPQDLNDLISLPGVSEYMARSTRCFAWNFPEPVIRKSTARIVNRILGTSLPWYSPEFRDAFTSLIPANAPGDFNYALLDLAYQKCAKTRTPQCTTCPILAFCAYGKSATH